MTDRELIQVVLRVSGAELERLVLVGSDLEFLKDLTRERLLTHTEVRLAASVLRRLLVESQLQTLWRNVGGSGATFLSVEARDLDRPLEAWPERWIKYAWAGGAQTGVAHHTGFVLGAIPKEEHEQYESVDAFLEVNPLPMTSETRSMSLDAWLRSTSVAIQTDGAGLVRISRESVLKYMANRKGGVHFDPRRTPEVKKGKKRWREVEHTLLDHGLLRVGHLSGPEFEVASMAQVVADADWATELIRAARELAPEDFSGDPSELKFWTGLASDGGDGWATTRMETPPPILEGETQTEPHA